jgi:hypothetical protein
MKRTLLIGIVAAVVAIGGGAFVADAANHSSLGSSSAQDGRFGGPGGFGGPPPNGARPFQADN